jgi:hypothetical protein
MTPTDFPCFLCGYAGPQTRTLLSRDPAMTEAEWEAYNGPREVIHCGACRMPIWEPDSGDGVAEPNLTMIPPGLRALAHQFLEARDVTAFLCLAGGHCRTQFVEDNAGLLHRLDLWDDAVLAHFALRDAHMPPRTEKP